MMIPTCFQKQNRIHVPNHQPVTLNIYVTMENHQRIEIVILPTNGDFTHCHGGEAIRCYFKLKASQSAPVATVPDLIIAEDENAEKRREEPGPPRVATAHSDPQKRGLNTLC